MMPLQVLRAPPSKGSSGRKLAREEILNLAHQVIDIVIQLESHHGQRRVTDLWLRP
jgi:hypothetical protein